MISFVVSLCLLILGYFFYGRFVDRIFDPDPSHATPAITKEDGVDFIAMPAWKVYLIQFLNIAGTGPIFGAIMGAKFGPSAYLWIVFGCIFAGAVHDYFSGMLSVRQGGASIPEIVGAYLGKGARKTILVVTIVLLLLVGTVFVYSPALIMGEIVGDGSSTAIMLWVCLIFLYFVFATLTPVDKIIGRIYPIFAFALMFMAIGLMIGLFVKWPDIPEVWEGIGNLGAEKGLPGMSSQRVFPCLFITIACGALSGFHATQSPLMARCIPNEKMGRPVFYGAMISEGIVALIWAAVASYFFFDGGAEAVGSDLTASAPVVVTKMSRAWLGVIGGVLAILGVVVAPISSGDTAFRSARLIVADFLKLDQRKPKNRLRIALPIFLATILLLWLNVSNEDGFNIIWRYFGWANQTLACFILWTISVYLVITRQHKPYYLVSLIPAAIITSVCVTYICTNNIGLRMPAEWSGSLSILSFVISIGVFHIWKLRREIRGLKEDLPKD